MIENPFVKHTDNVQINNNELQDERVTFLSGFFLIP